MKDPEARAIRQTSAGWLIQRLSTRFEAAMTAALEPHGLALGQMGLLLAVLESGGMTQTELGTIFAMPAWKISRHLDGLEAAGLIKRQADPESRRTHRIHATDKARALDPQLRAATREVNASVLEPLAPQQRAQLVDLLRQVVLPVEKF
ncbi:MAG: MarR family winged helix-turn-helix transcriptional regulator [Pararhodobacter sp.]